MNITKHAALIAKLLLEDIRESDETSDVELTVKKKTTHDVQLSSTNNFDQNFEEP